MAELAFLLHHVPLPSIIVMVYGTIVLGLAERGMVDRATLLVMSMTWLTGLPKEMLP